MVASFIGCVLCDVWDQAEKKFQYRALKKKKKQNRLAKLQYMKLTPGFFL